MKVSDLARLAQRTDLVAFCQELGAPLALLVGADTSKSGRAPTTPGPQTLHHRPRVRFIDPATFATQVAHMIPPQTTLVLGRSADADLTITSSCVSQRHAQLSSRADGRFEVADLGSRNGTLVQGALVSTGSRVLMDYGDTLQVGTVLFKLYRPETLHRTLRAMILPAEL